MENNENNEEIESIKKSLKSLAEIIVSYLNTFFTENHRILLKKKIEAIL